MRLDWLPCFQKMPCPNICKIQAFHSAEAEAYDEAGAAVDELCPQPKRCGSDVMKGSKLLEMWLEISIATKPAFLANSLGCLSDSKIRNRYSISEEKSCSFSTARSLARNAVHLIQSTASSLCLPKIPKSVASYQCSIVASCSSQHAQTIS